MGTETEKLQETIKKLLVELDWSINKFSEFIYLEIHETDTENEIKKFQEKVKKELQRKTTKPEKLEKYLDILIANERKVQKLDIVFNKYIPQNSVSSYLSEEMKKISKEINDELRNTDD